LGERIRAPGTTRVPTVRAAKRAIPGIARVVLFVTLLLAAWPLPASAGAGSGGRVEGARDIGLLRGIMRPPAPYWPKEFAFVYDGGLFHLIYMRRNKNLTDPYTNFEFGHAISTDLVNWFQLDTLLDVQPGTWDEGHVWAPTLIRGGNTWYLFYAGVQDLPFPWSLYQRIGVATSPDLMTWTHYDQPVLTGNMISWAFADSSTFDGAQLRDPYVMEDPEHPDQWIMYYVTEAAAARGQLLIGASRNNGGLTPWQDIGPLWCSDNAHFWGWNESPLVFEHAGLWYLFSTTTSGHPIGFRVGPGPLADSTQWSGKYRLYDFAGGSTRNSDAWFAAEFLSVAGHDYFAYVDSDLEAICIEEIAWGTPPAFFSLQPPSVTAVRLAAPAARIGLRVVGRARRGSGVTFAAALPEAREARLELYDVSGRRLRVLRPGVLSAGETVVPWDGRDEEGRTLPCSMYFARLVTSAGGAVSRVPLTD
jgi:hypothetical protein